MDIRIEKPHIPSLVRAISSKSDVHRLLICASLSSGETVLRCPDQNDDIRATVRVLRALGAGIKEEADFFRIKPIKKQELTEETLLDCGESGSTLRFLLPVAAALGRKARFTGHGRLMSRPMEPLIACLCAHGAEIRQSKDMIELEGRLSPGTFEIPGDISSQYVSGLLFALPLLGKDSILALSTKLESAPYVEMTIRALARFGAQIRQQEGVYRAVTGYGSSPGKVTSQGDWSNAAFFLACGAVGEKPVTVTGLDYDAPQGDKAICGLLKAFGAEVEIGEDKVTVSPCTLHGVEIDARDIPDLVPVLAVVAAKAVGNTRIYNASRLRIKESDRIKTVLSMLSALGADAEETADGMIIHGGKALCSGEVDGANDHRIVMSAAVAALACKGAVTIHGAQAVSKSYPDFFDDYFGRK